jgi:hypothetical protein
MNIIAPHDSGLAKSVIKTSRFDELLTCGHMKIKEPPQKTVVVTCTGAMKEVIGRADLFHFTGENKVEMTFKLKVVIHPMITQDILLGTDITGSETKVAEANDYICLTQTYNVDWNK